MLRHLRTVVTISALCFSLPLWAATTDTEATLGGLIPLQNKVIVVTENPEPQVWINMMPVIDPKATPTADVFMTIYNSTQRDIRYRFTSSQLFDIVLTDAYGNVVSRWSRGRYFLHVISDVTIAPGTAKRVGGSIELTDDKGMPLAPGGYTLAIELRSSPLAGTSHTPGSQAPGSQMPLRIDWLY